MMNKRAQTACSSNKQRHQANLMRQMKQTKELQQLEKQTSLHTHLHQSKSTTQLHHHANKQLHSHPFNPFYQLSAKPLQPNRKTKHQKIFNSPLEKQVFQLQKLKGKRKNMPSLVNDEKQICQNGWKQFSSQIQRKTISNFMDIRSEAQEIKKRHKISAIVISDGVNLQGDPGSLFLGDEKISDLWRAVKGQGLHETSFGYLKLSDLFNDIKRSVTLNNAYRLCVRSRQYKRSNQFELTDQKFKCLIYLSENANKLPSRKYDELMKKNYFLP